MLSHNKVWYNKIYLLTLRRWEPYCEREPIGSSNSGQSVLWEKGMKNVCEGETGSEMSLDIWINEESTYETRDKLEM